MFLGWILGKISDVSTLTYLLHFWQCIVRIYPDFQEHLNQSRSQAAGLKHGTEDVATYKRINEPLTLTLTLTVLCLILAFFSLQSSIEAA